MANIADAEAWLEKRLKSTQSILTFDFLLELHRRMFNKVWNWAGTFRKAEKNIGVAPAAIREELQKLFLDTELWIEKGIFPVDELAARFHHRLVQIHPFPNGNGRHARLMTEALLTQLGAAPFSWGSGNLVAQGAVRDPYLSALRRADVGDWAPLFAFVRA